MVYDYMVVGSGITGLTVTRLLARQGGRILLVEKAPVLGGSIKRFKLKGAPFDVGFHFTGGFAEDGRGCLDEMLGVLGVRERIKPIYYPREACHRMIFPGEGVDFVAPCGIETLEEKLKREFPQVREGVGKYFARFRHVIEQTPTLRVAGFDEAPAHLEEDCVSLQQVFNECVPDPLVQAILGGFCMCYGSRPDEVSFATHCRISFGMHESLARVEDGGQAFVDALVEANSQEKVEVRTGVSIKSCEDVKDRKVGRFVLTDGTEVSARTCIFTIHPRNILETLPGEHLSNAFKARVGDFEPSIAFFAMFGKLSGEGAYDVAPITSILPELDLNKMLTCRTAEPVDGPVVVLRSVERGEKKSVETLTALEVTFPEWTKPWAESSIGKRSAEYYRYKEARVASLLKRLGEVLPECRDRLEVLDSASSLTFRDYLNSPDGGAYGIRQKLGQFNVSGRLPLTNLYAAGQSALLPGVVGAMTSAFLVCRSVLGREAFKQLLAERP